MLGPDTMGHTGTGQPVQGWQPPHHLDNIARADCVQPTPAYFDFCCVEHLSSFSCRASESHPIGLMSHSQFTVNVWVTFQW